MVDTSLSNIHQDRRSYTDFQHMITYHLCLSDIFLREYFVFSLDIPTPGCGKGVFTIVCLERCFDV